MRHSSFFVPAVVLALSGAACAQSAHPSPLQQRIEQLYRSQQRAEAERLLARAPRAATWRAHRGVEVRAVFHSRAKGLTIEAVRKDQRAGELLVAVPPGTWAQSCTDRRYEDWPRPQDLLLIQARVLRLAPGQQRASVTLPVACAAFRRPGPRATRAYTLQLAQPGSKLDRLAQLLCAKELGHERDPELALALWIAHEGLGYERLKQSAGFHTFRTPRKKVRVEHGRAAARLLREAGLEPADFEFFKAQGYRPAPKAKQPAAKQPAAKQPAKPAPPKPAPERPADLS